jgi:osmotically-inducible protein OsmY
MKSNEAIQKDVQDAIKWEPMLRAAQIGVTVNDGIVTLTGNVDNYAKKWEAEQATKKVNGVQEVVEEISVQLDASRIENDQEMATAILNGLLYNWDVPNERIKVTLENGWVTLEGDVEWNHQREAAEMSVHNQRGVKGITNKIVIRNKSKDNIELKDIKSALTRNAAMNDADIEVKVSENKVSLHGTVHSFYQKDEAERTAWNAPGVYNVQNDLVIEYR